MFLVLYPIGMLSEVGLIYVTMPYMKVIRITEDMKSSMLFTSVRVLLNSSIYCGWQASNKYCLQMPNKWNFSFNYHYASVLLVGIYFPGTLSLQLLTKGIHMYYLTRHLFISSGWLQDFHTCTVICSLGGRWSCQRQNPHDFWMCKLCASTDDTSHQRISTICVTLFSCFLSFPDQ